LTWARAKHHTKAIEVIAGRTCVHHLDRAASQPECDGPERSGPRPIHQAVDLRGQKAALCEALGALARLAIGIGYSF
jgi:hypothetical protein